MNLVRRIFIDKRAALLIIGGLLLVDLILYGAVISPLEGVVARANTRAEGASEAALTARNTLAEAQAVLKGATRVDRELAAFYANVLPEDLMEAREIIYPALAALATEANLALERRTSVRGQDEDGLLGWLQTTMRLVGDYRDIRQFMESLESGPNFLVIEEVALSQTPDAGDSELALSMTVATYFSLRDGV